MLFAPIGNPLKVKKCAFSYRTLLCSLAILQPNKRFWCLIISCKINITLKFSITFQNVASIMVL